MSTNTNQIPTVSVSVISHKEIEKEEARRAERRATPVVDSVEIESGSQCAPSADTESPKSASRKGSHQSSHAQLLKTRSDLKQDIVRAGFSATDQETDGEKLEEHASQVLEKVEDKIAEMKAQGKEGPQLDRLEKIQMRLLESFTKYQGAFLSANGIEQAPRENVVSEPDFVKSSAESPEETALWSQLSKELGVFGIKVAHKNIEIVQSDLLKAGKEGLSALKTRETALKEEETAAKDSLKQATTPDEKQKAEKRLQEVQAELSTLVQKKLELQKSFTRAEGLSDKIVQMQTKRELGVEQEEISRPVVEKTPEAQQAPQRSEGSVVRIQSAQERARPSTDSLHTASESNSSESAFVSTPDYSGTMLSIASSGSRLREDARKTDKQIEQLLRAALSGNWEAVKTALILLDKRASQVMVGMGALTVKSMRSYEKYMAGLSAELQRLTGNEADYNAQLASINSEMNMYSMNRQAISNFLRDTMSMAETIQNLTKGVLDSDQRRIPRG